MQRHPFGGLPQRDPEAVLRATDIIGALETDVFEALFAGFCDIVQEVGDEHNDCQHVGPMVIIGIDLNSDLTDIVALSSPQTIEGNPIEPRPYKPDGLEDFDVIGMVQANNSLEAPEAIQGALIEQLSTQWHVLMMLEEMADEFQSMSMMDDTSLDQENLPFEDINSPFDPNIPEMNPDFDDKLEDLFEELTRSLENTDLPNQHNPPTSAFDQYDAEEVEHLELTENGLQCEHCGAIYDHEAADEAIRCCPSDSPDDATPLDDEEPEFDN